MTSNSKIAEALAAFNRNELDRARTLAKAQIVDDQGPPEADHLLGLIDCRSGRMDSGIRHLRAALDAQPDNAGFRVMLARALVDSRRADEAFAVAARPIGTTPAELALWHVRAEAAQALGNHSEAAEGWKILCVARPDDWRVWANYGNALAGLERWEEAAKALRRALALNPNEPSIQQGFAAALTKAGFYAEAADQLRNMLESGPDDSSVRLTLSRLLADLGRHEESMAELDNAARLAVGEGASNGDDVSLIRVALPDRKDSSEPISTAEMRSLRELALLLERTNRMDALRTLLDDAEELGVLREQLGYPAAAIALRDGDVAGARDLLLADDPNSDSVRWHALMARIADKLGDAAMAFAEAEAMHRSVANRDQWLRKAADYRQWIGTLASTVNSDWVSELNPLRDSDRRAPAFLVGFPRSGTTLLDTFLMGHSGIRVVEEQHMLNKAEAVVGPLSGLTQRSVERLGQARRAYFAELDRHVAPEFEGLVIDKLPLNMLGLPLIYAIFPDARIIFAQRHPCDVILSGFMQAFALNDAMACYLELGDAASFYDAAMQLFLQSRELLPLQFHTLVYEELVATPETALRPLIAFLGLEWLSELLNHQTTAKARGAISTPSYDQVVQPLSKAPSGRWRRYEKQLEPVLRVLLPWAERLGYVD